MEGEDGISSSHSCANNKVVKFLSLTIKINFRKFDPRFVPAYALLRNLVSISPLRFASIYNGSLA